MKKIITSIILFLIIAYLGINYLLLKNDNNLKVHFLEAGQADASLIQTPYGQNIAIDLGSEKAFLELEKILPWWDRKIDILIISHPHSDHIEGMPNLINKYEVSSIYFTGVSYDSETYKEIISLAKLKNIPLLIPEMGHKIKLGKDCFLKFIYPLSSSEGLSPVNLNNDSIVNKLKCNNHSFLFTGDIEEDIENKILEMDYNLKSDVLKVAHHGSISSSQEKFLEEVMPKISIISVGKNNFGHPSLRVINRLKKIGSEVLRTDVYGTISIISDGQNIFKQVSK